MRARGLRSALAALAAAAVAILPAVATGRGLDGLGRLEREAALEALAARGLDVHPSPEGRRIGRVHVVTLEVFSERDGPFAWFNIFHRTTRELAVRRESLLQPGDAYGAAKAEETARNLRAAVSLSGVVAVLPVRALAPDEVDLLIVTRDVWSLRLNTDFEIQDGHLVFLTTSLSENNLLGWRKLVALYADLDQGNVEIGPTYRDPNILGSRLALRASLRAVLARDGDAFEGTKSSVAIAYPLFSLASRWGASLGVTTIDEVARPFFLGARVARVDLRSTPEPENLPWSYRLRQASVQTAVTRSFPGAVIQRVSLGHAFYVVRSGFAPGFPGDPAVRDAFAREIFPPRERVSSLRFAYALFLPRYVTTRDLDTYDLAETRRLGPSVDLGVGRALRALGSDADFSTLSAGLAWTWDAWGGLQHVSASWSARADGRVLGDQSYAAGAYAASPVLGCAARLIAEVQAGALVDDTRNRVPFVLGGTSGLRGHTIGDLAGQAYLLAHVELRTQPVAWRALRLGATLFYDTGDAATPGALAASAPGPVRAARALAALHPRHDLGAGLRMLIPQLDPYVLRMDWAFATTTTYGPTGALRTRAGWPGRFSFGFRQAF